MINFKQHTIVESFQKGDKIVIDGESVTITKVDKEFEIVYFEDSEGKKDSRGFEEL